MSDTNGARRLAVYAVPESKDGEKKFWPKIGVAFANRDGSFSLLLDALPLGTNKLQMREAFPPVEARNGNGAVRRDLEVVEVRP
ncbi:hypothetical protein [Anaeromyxobacter oryzae]|uniref:Uncharacterized protein n=1 Tax=Anaeromyxobacter oryzae TaxID=2918170 RepID=A0ABM7WRS7_9BACT|nr:hypothetical protein [Anaeromyxobacter oryzae]BDG02174.1 hypothetical protein AMOR_11700 [Anaeromyxobacter oryzae]